MTTLMVTHDVDNVDHWLASGKREELFGPLGITARPFVDADRSIHTGLVVEVPDDGLYSTACGPDAVGDGIRAPFTVTGPASRSTNTPARKPGIEPPWPTRVRSSTLSTWRPSP